MKKYLDWLVIEYKRMALRLFSAVKKAVILVIALAIIGMIAFCTYKYIEDNGLELSKITVGYVADDDMITNLAISYVEDMESVQSICELVRVTDEKQGLKKLENGELSALIVLPQNVIDEINSGSNAHGKLYLPSDNTGWNVDSGLGNVAAVLFKQLSQAGMGMLGVAQAEIYATGTILDRSMDYDALYNDIDRFNLGQVASREKLFTYKNLSVTGNDTYTVYYLSAFLTIYMMFTGLFYGEYLKRSYGESLYAKRRMGIGYIYQLFSRYLAGMILGAVTILLPIAIMYIPAVREYVVVNLSAKGIIAVLVATIFMTIFNVLIFEVAQNRQSALVTICVNVILQAYLSGCIVPSVLLPNKISEFGEYMPAAYIKKAFRMMITGKTTEYGNTILGLVLWGFIIFAINIPVLLIKENIRPKDEKKIRQNSNGKYHITTLPMIVLRRFVHKKSIWICLILAIAASVSIVATERTSDTNIVVAFYDESGECAQSLIEYEGLVNFVEYDSVEEVRLAILRDEAECGYIIPKDITDKMISQMSNGVVTVYQDDDSIAVSVVNEVIFERLFKNVSLRWYEEYILQIDDSVGALIEQAFEEKLNAGITFDIDIEYLGDNIEKTSQVSENKATYPVEGVVVILVAVCGIYGIIQVVDDERKKRFYRCNKYSIYILTILIPILFGVVAGVIIIRFLRI